MNTLENKQNKLPPHLIIALVVIMILIASMYFFLSSYIADLSKALNPHYKYYWWYMGLIGFLCALSIFLRIKYPPNPVPSPLELKEEYREDNRSFSYAPLTIPLLFGISISLLVVCLIENKDHLRGFLLATWFVHLGLSSVFQTLANRRDTGSIFYRYSRSSEDEKVIASNED